MRKSLSSTLGLDYPNLTKYRRVNTENGICKPGGSATEKFKIGARCKANRPGFPEDAEDIPKEE